MSTPQPPTNYQWNGNNLSFDLPVGTIGILIKYKKDGESEIYTVYESVFSAPTTVTLPASVGPSGIIYGITTQSSTGGWGTPTQESITNTP